MFCHQLWVVLVLVHATASSSPLIVNVSDKGTDSSSCLQNNNTQACRTFKFVLKQLLSSSGSLESDVILVNILDNQSLDASPLYVLNNSFTLVVTGVGYPSITFSSKDSLSFYSNHSSNFNFTWRGLVFNGGGILHQNVRSVTFDDCKLNLGVGVFYMQKVIINDSIIDTNADCPSISLIARDGCSSGNVSSVVFSSNTISNCQIPLTRNLLTFTTFCNVTINDNVFTHLDSTDAVRLMLVRGSIMSLIFQNNSFVENTMGPPIEFDISGSNGQITVQQNRFLHNVIPFGISALIRAIFYFGLIQNSKLNVIFSENLYNNNSELLFLRLQAESDSSSVIVTLDSETLINNIGPSNTHRCIPSSDLFTSSGCFGLFILEELKELSLSNITASGNRININKNAIPRGDEISSQGSSKRYSSLFFIANVSNTFLSDTVFSNNYGTSIIFWRLLINLDIDPPFSLTLSGNVLFANNIGILGGAFAAYNKEINIYTKPSTHLNFIENYASYGGAGYIENMVFGVCDNNLTINFTGNSAVTNGDAYILFH